MLPKTRILVTALLGLALIAVPAGAADLTESLKKGTPDLKSAGPLAFGPDGVLFVGDSQGAAIFAIDTGDRGPMAEGALKIDKLDEKLGSLLGTDAKGVTINDLAVNPASGNAYVSVSRGQGATAAPAILRITRKGGKIEEVPLKDVKFSKAMLPNASDKKRAEAITDLAFIKDKVIVAGLSNEEFASNLRSIPFPFKDADKGSSVEIFHGAHGKFETHSPVRTFAVYDIKGETNLLAAYTCTPLVRFPVSQLKPGDKVKGTTIAELGSGNQPLDMVIYQRDGKDFILIANNRRGIMKVTTEGIDKVEAIKNQVERGATAGLSYEKIAEKIPEWKGVMQLDRLDKGNALVLIRTEAGALNLETLPLP